MVAPYARRTARLNAALELIGFALGGEAGARVLHQLAMAAGLTPCCTPFWRVSVAFRRGHRYGALLVELERRSVVDFLSDRTLETVNSKVVAIAEIALCVGVTRETVYVYSIVKYRIDLCDPIFHMDSYS